ncbi:MAG: SPASM domain-containing protein [Deltaproteobacteria bacterium]|nr:SPASM domain-containing protein [Deltaproteobacteria bacterium]
MNRKPMNIGFDTFKKACESLEAGTYIMMLGNGEPLFNRYVYDMTEYAVKKGLLVGITTNATMFTDKNIRKLIETGVHRVQISFDAVFEEIYRRSINTIGKHFNFANSLQRVLKFIYIARTEYKQSPFITISEVMTDEVIAVNSKNRAFWNKIPIDNLYEGPLLSLQTDSSIYKEQDFTKSEEWKICSNPFVCTKINADGSVNACVLDFSSKYIIGNINENSLSDIINSDKAIRLRKALYEQDINFLSDIGYNCHKCNAWTNSATGGIEGYCKNSFPITYGLMANEIYKSNSYPTEKILLLKELLDNFSSEKIEEIINQE